MSVFNFVTEELIPEEEARTITAPYWAELTTVWCSAWSDWGKMDEDHRRRLGETPCTPPVVRNAFAQSYARECFSGREDEGLVVCSAIPNVFAFYIKSRVLLRFNSLGADFAVHNTDKSPLKDAYFRQDSIPGIENAATRLTVGYLTNEAKVQMACVAISLQVGPDPAYHFLIDRSEECAIPIPTTVVPPAPTMPSERLHRIKPR